MRGSGSVWQRADGVWAAAVSLGVVDGHRERETVYGPSEDVVRAKLARMHLLLGGGGALPSKVSLGDYLASWIDRVARDLAPRTAQGYRSIIYGADGRGKIPATPGMPGWLLAVPLGKLNGGHVQAWLDTLDGSPRTVAWKRNTLRAALNDAMRRGLVERNAAALARPPRQKRPRRPVLTAADCRAILAALDGWRYQAAAAVAIGCGLRQGELLGLTWADLVTDRLTVQAALHRVGGEYVRSATKTEASDASVPVPGFVWDHLAAWEAIQADEWAASHPDGEPVAIDDARHAGLMFTTSSGMPVNGSVVTHQFQDRLKVAGIASIPWHALRHATADMLADLVPQTVARDYLRHASVTTTQDHYTGSAWASLERAAVALDRAMGE